MSHSKLTVWPRSDAARSRPRKKRMVTNTNLSLLRPLKPGIFLAGGCRGAQQQRDRLYAGLLGLARAQSEWLRSGGSELPGSGGVLPPRFIPPLSQGCLIGAEPTYAENINPFIF